MSVFQDILRVLRDGITIKPSIVVTNRVTVPGIGTGSAYAAGDAFGTRFVFEVPPKGTITRAIFIDKDNEGIQKDIVMFSREFTETADNAAFDPSDVDMTSHLGVASVNVFYDFGSNRGGEAVPDLEYSLPDGRIYCQIVTKGADNIAAGAIPEVYLVVKT